MKRRTVAVAALVFLMIGLLVVQIWWMERQNDLREKRRLRRQEEEAAWLARPQLPGQPWVPPPPTYYEPPPTPPILLINGFFPIVLALVAAYELKKRKEREAEEEARTTYTEEDLMADWEFKIVRSPVGLFDRPAFLARILGEEAAGGWRLVEKFDGHRVRLKRMPGSPAGPPGYDPFRTIVGPKSCVHLALWVFCAFCVAAAVGMAILALADSSAAVNAGTIAVLGALVLGWLAVRQRAKYRRLAG